MIVQTKSALNLKNIVFEEANLHYNTLRCTSKSPSAPVGRGLADEIRKVSSADHRDLCGGCSRRYFVSVGSGFGAERRQQAAALQFGGFDGTLYLWKSPEQVIIKAEILPRNP